MLEVIQYLMDARNIETVSFCTSDMLQWLTFRGLKNISAIPIKQYLQNEWNLKPSPNSNAYTQFIIAANGNIYERKSRGRFYQVSHQFLLKLEENDEI